MAQLWCSYKLFATTQKSILLSIQLSLFLTLATKHTVDVSNDQSECKITTGITKYSKRSSIIKYPTTDQIKANTGTELADNYHD